MGAGLQFWFGRTLEGRKQLALQRSQAYVDYFKAFALLAQHGKSEPHLAMAADAKVRVCIYGAPEVIKILSQFERAGAVVDTPANAGIIIQLLQAMRKDTGARDTSFMQADMEHVLFGPRFRNAKA